MSHILAPPIQDGVHDFPIGHRLKISNFCFLFEGSSYGAQLSESRTQRDEIQKIKVLKSALGPNIISQGCPVRRRIQDLHECPIFALYSCDCHGPERTRSSFKFQSSIESFPAPYFFFILKAFLISSSENYEVQKESINSLFIIVKTYTFVRIRKFNYIFI